MANKMNSSAILASLSPQEILDFQVRNGMIDLDDVRASIVDTERKKILKAHPYAISHGKDGRWRTWVPDKNAKDGRKKIAKSTKEKIEEAVVCYYLENDEELKRKRMTLRDLYPEWLEYKKLHSSETTIPSQTGRSIMRTIRILFLSLIKGSEKSLRSNSMSGYTR